MVIMSDDLRFISCCGSCDQLDRDAMYELTGNQLYKFQRFMIVCTNCGNKRCPHAWNHRYKCTGSNETDQVPELLPGFTDAGPQKVLDPEVKAIIEKQLQAL